MAEPALYRCRVMHKRMRPAMHQLDYQIFSVFLDLEDLEAADRNTRLFSVDRFNLLSFHQRDRGDARVEGLRAYITERLDAAGFHGATMRVRILTMPRVLGFAFNPLSVYYCYDQQEQLAAILYEVDNTFGERHTYVLAADPHSQITRQTCDKAFYVSPFMPMRLQYRFRTSMPAARLALVIEVVDAEGLLMIARQTGERRPLNDRQILRCLSSLIFQSVKVLLGIHWEALKIWLKGVRLVPKPRLRDPAVSKLANDAEL